MTRYRFIEAESSRYPVAQVCRIAQVSRAAYYAWKGTPASARAAEDAALTAKIRAIHAASFCRSWAISSKLRPSPSR